MCNYDQAEIALHARDAAVELRVMDANLQLKGHAFGNLQLRVSPGVYQLEYRAGSQIQQKLIAVRAGKIYSEVDIQIEFPTPIPLEGTSTTRETYQEAVAELFAEPVQANLDRSGLLLLVRNMERDSKAPITRERITGWKLLDRALNPLADIDIAATVNETLEWIGWKKELPAGAYVLQMERGTNESFRQPLWLSEGWLIGIFVPNLAQASAPELASIQMFSLAAGWKKFDEPNHHALRAAELALAGLREGRAVLPSNELMNLLNGKFANPMLGIIGAHALLFSRDPDAELFATVIRNLAILVPEHPDVAALNYIGHRRFPSSQLSPPTPVAWPPMLLAGYRGLLECDAYNPGAIVPGSLAETIAPQLLVQGAWTTWRYQAQPLVIPAPETMADIPEWLFATAESIDFKREELANFFPNKAVAKILKNAASTGDVRGRETFWRELPQGSATRKIVRHLAESMQYAGLENFAKALADIDPVQLCRDVALPMAVVKRVIAGLTFLTHEEVFWLGADGDVSSTWRDDTLDKGAWHQPFAIAIPNSVRTGSPLVAISRNPKQVEVFWIGADGNVSSTWQDNNVDSGVWHQPFGIASPNSVGGDSPLVAISRNPSHQEVFWIGANGDVSSTWRDDNVDKGAWHQPFAIVIPNSVRTGSPLVAISRNPSQVELFWIRADGNVGSTYQNDNVDKGAWHQPFAIVIPNSVRTGSPLVAISRNSSHEEVFWIGANGDVSSTWRDDNADNGAWHQPFAIAIPNSVRTDSPLVAISRNPSQVEVFWVGADGNVGSTWQDSNVDKGAWHPPFAIAVPNSVRTGSPLVAISRNPSHEEVFWIGANGDVSSTWRDDNADDGAWHQPFVIAIPNSVRAGSPLVAISRNPIQVEVFWIGADGNVSSNWQNDNVGQRCLATTVLYCISQFCQTRFSARRDFPACQKWRCTEIDVTLVL